MKCRAELICYRGFWVLAAICVALTSRADAQVYPRHNYRQHVPSYRYCPPGSHDVPPADGETIETPRRGADGQPITPRDGEQSTDATTPDMTAPTAPSPAPSSVASAPAAAAPSMIGDHFGNGFSFALSSKGSLSTAGGLRRVKIAENVSPMPQDRVFFNFNHFQNSVTTSNDPNNLANIERYTVGVEKTFLHNMTSIEIRGPMTHGLDADQNIAPGSDNIGGEFGNMVITPKVLLAGGCSWRLSAGMGVQLPTADDARLFSGTTLLTEVENDAVHLQPFLGLMVTPTSRAFALGYLQYDVDVSGFDARNTPAGGGQVGHFEDPTFLYLDLQLGYWVYQSCNRCSWLTGIAPVVELHYATNVEDFVGVPGVINVTATQVDILNLTAGLKFQAGCTTFTVSAAAPLRNDDNRQFDTEIIAQLQYGF